MSCVMSLRAKRRGLRYVTSSRVIREPPYSRNTCPFCTFPKIFSEYNKLTTNTDILHVCSTFNGGSEALYEEEGGMVTTHDTVSVVIYCTHTRVKCFTCTRVLSRIDGSRENAELHAQSYAPIRDGAQSYAPIRNRALKRNFAYA